MNAYFNYNKDDKTKTVRNLNIFKSKYIINNRCIDRIRSRDKILIFEKFMFQIK